MQFRIHVDTRGQQNPVLIGEPQFALMNRLGELIEQLALLADQPGGPVEVTQLVRNASISPVGARKDTDLVTRALPRVSPFSSAITR